jgi:hypothetical protein
MLRCCFVVALAFLLVQKISVTENSQGGQQVGNNDDE